MSSLRNAERIEEEFPKFYNDDKEAFDEGVFVSEFVNDDEDDEDDYEYDYIREPRNEFEKALSKMDGVIRQSEEDAQNLSHDLKVIESKNVSTERRILKLLQDAAEFRSRLSAFLQSYSRQPSWRERVTSSSDHVSMASPRGYMPMTSPRGHMTTTSPRGRMPMTSPRGRMTTTSPRDYMTMTSSPRRHKATYAIFLKQNSIEQPVHVNIPLNEEDKVLIY